MYRWSIQNLSGEYYGVAPKFPYRTEAFFLPTHRSQVQPPIEISLGQWKLLCPSVWFSLESNCFQWLVNARFKSLGPFLNLGNLQRIIPKEIFKTPCGNILRLLLQPHYSSVSSAAQSCYPLSLIGVILERCLNKPPTFKSPNLRYVSQDPELWWLAQESYGTYSIVGFSFLETSRVSLNFQVLLGYFGFLGTRD